MNDSKVFTYWEFFCEYLAYVSQYYIPLVTIAILLVADIILAVKKDERRYVLWSLTLIFTLIIYVICKSSLDYIFYIDEIVHM